MIKPKRAQQNICVDELVVSTCAERFGQASLCDTPVEFHLKQAILSSDVSLSEQNIVESRSSNRGNAPLVTFNRHSVLQSGNSQLSARLWQSAHDKPDTQPPEEKKKEQCGTRTQKQNAF